MQEIKKESERENQLAAFMRKNDRRLSIIIFIIGLYLLTASIWSLIYFQEENNLDIFFIVDVILGTVFCVLAVLSPSIDKWRVARLNGVPLPPCGWGMLALSIFWVLILFVDIRLIVYSPHSDWTSDPQSVLNFLNNFGFLVFYLIAAFLVEVPQAMRSFHLSIQIHIRGFDGLKRVSIPMECWRDERIINIITRLLCSSSFKRRLAKFQIAPNPQIKLLHHNKVLMPGSTPAQAGFKLYTRLTVAFSEEKQY